MGVSVVPADSSADLTRRIDAAIAEVYRTDRQGNEQERAESRRAIQALGAFGAPAVERVLQLYRDSDAGPREHARLLNALGTAASNAQATARRAVARACPQRYVDHLGGTLDPAEIGIVADVHDPRVTPLLITLLRHFDASVRRTAALALLGRIEGKGSDDRRTRTLAEQAVLDLLEDESLAVRAIAAYAVARRSQVDGITAYQQILRPTEPETLTFADVQQRIAALRHGESLPPPL